MKSIALLAAFALSALFVVNAAAFQPPARSVGPGIGNLQNPGTESPCGNGNMVFNADGSYENGYAWDGYGGIALPYYGAWAECFQGNVSVCGVIFDFTQVGYQHGQTMDVYLWSDNGGVPGLVLSVTTGVDPGTIAEWPNISRHFVSLDNPVVPLGAFWAGFWGDWFYSPPAWFIAADLNGPGPGCPFTDVAPGVGYPTGWINSSVIFGYTHALGIGVEVHQLNPLDVPSHPGGEDVSWGKIKELNR